MIESKPLPELATTCISLATDQFHRLVNEISAETLEAIGLSASAGWKVNFERKCIEREVPDEVPNEMTREEPAGG